MRTAWSYLARPKTNRRRNLADETARLYGCSSPRSSQEQEEWQLKRFNALWKDIRVSVPFYGSLVETGRIPTSFENWEHFASVMPKIDRSIVQKYGSDLAFKSKPGFWRITGGSTGQPVHIPAWNSESRETEANEWFARSWWKVDPADTSFRIWGHYHRLGFGWRGWIRRHIRQLKDRALGIYRFSAYNLSRPRLEEAVRSYESFRGDYVVGYSNALWQFALVMREVQGEAKHRAKMILATSESFPSPECREELEEIFCAPVVMEYGCEETGILAQTDESKEYRVFWRSYFIEAVEQGDLGYKVLVTSLYPRCFPLVRYVVGDEIMLSDPKFGVTEFAEVVGRSTEALKIDSNTVLHPRVVMHAVKDSANVAGFQIVLEDSKLVLLLTAREELSASDFAKIRHRFGLISPALANLPIRQVETLEQTRAGKTPTILRR